MPDQDFQEHEEQQQPPVDNEDAAQDEATAPDGGQSESGQPQTDAAPERQTLQDESTQLKDQLLRKIAEFENFKRRTRDEKDALMKYGAEPVLRDLLPVLDDFERSLASGKEHPDFDSFYKGVEIIYAKLLKTLEQRGLRPMDAVGKPFDVDYHDALLQIPNADVEPGTVLDQAEKGYLLHDKVIRHAKVTVSKEVE
ncbi:MAG: nucleotide exchange factor GrpE [Ignavibacteria bacterium]|nr:MAG: nucleotide exchange factor GrpE [Ignavibacteria bacterium]